MSAKKVKQFHNKHGIEQGFTGEELANTLLFISTLDNTNKYNLPPVVKCVVEELIETLEALCLNGKSEVLKESTDLLYTVYGLQCALGLEEVSDEAFDRVHKSNMTKDVDPNRQGKVVKGEHYRPPTLEDLCY